MTAGYAHSFDPDTYKCHFCGVTKADFEDRLAPAVCVPIITSTSAPSEGPSVQAEGERDDPETKCHHLAHVAWNALALMVYEMRGLGEDDLNRRTK